ncbi:MAG: AMP-binding protein [Thermodesulfobacteriota bacterium]|nr:AMP-binding protein [Thermodesulfobacteriota bacterium]
MTTEKDIDTLPKLMLRNYLRYGDSKVAMRKKDFGLWLTYTWKEYYEHVKWCSLGLISLGLKQGDKVCIIGDNDPQYYWAELAVQSAKGTAIGIFVDSMDEEVKYYVNHSDAKFVFAEDQEQCDKLLNLKDEDAIPNVKRVIYWDPKGLWSYDDPILLSFEGLEEIGKKYELDHPDLYEENVRAGKGSDIACFCYTSGTTGLPKAAMMSHDSAIFFGRGIRSVDPWYDTDEYLSYVSPAWAAEQFLGIASGLDGALCVSFPEESETVQEDIVDLGPQILFYSARLWEIMVSEIQVKIADTLRWKRFLYNTAMKIGHKMTDFAEKKEEPGVLWKGLYLFANLIALRSLRHRMGFARTRVGYTAGAAVSPDIIRFFHALGLNLKNIYGSTEASVVTIPRQADFKYDSVGTPIEGCEIKIIDGEIVVKNPGLFSGYYKNPEATAEKIKDGWYYTGDSGFFDDEGHLIYWDRVDELLELKGGEKYSPQYIEIRLRFSPYIRDCVVVGGKDRDYIGTLINIDYGNVGKWAEKKRIAYTTFVDLSQKPEVADLIRGEIIKVNKEIPEFAHVKRFVNLHKEFDPDEAELTRTRKLRRTFVEKRYEDIIESLYQEKDVIHVEAPVTYRDGRKGVIKTEIHVHGLD